MLRLSTNQKLKNNKMFLELTPLEKTRSYKELRIGL